ncbi:hypothetical protein HDV00_008233 [Rhizophlyctis rosea]|nr:hypothetical protein HDV00_008233 [Rhizophlyctis rosea]
MRERCEVLSQEADAGLFLKSVTTFAEKPNERVQEYTDRWNGKVNIFRNINNFAEDKDKAPVTDSQLADTYIYGLEYNAILVAKLKKLKIILTAGGNLAGFVKAVSEEVQPIEISTHK